AAGPNQEIEELISAVTIDHKGSGGGREGDGCDSDGAVGGKKNKAESSSAGARQLALPPPLPPALSSSIETDAVLVLTPITAAIKRHKADAAATEKRLNNMSRIRRRWATVEKRVFGVPLEQLLCSSEYCSAGQLDPAIAVPDALEQLIESLSEPLVLSEPELFTTSCESATLTPLIRSLDQCQGVPDPSPGGSALACAMLAFLMELPEPLLPKTLQDALVDCCQLPDDHECARSRNFAFLLLGLPWYNKATLVRVVHLFRRALQ
ncbi:unnamed protein product, partial [Chrysoparadoxa australica]